MIIGAQLYTVRDYTKTLDEFSETLKKVADIGYTNVQVSGTCKYEPEWLAEQLKANGLTCSITHSYHYPEVLYKTQDVIKAYNTFDCKYVGLGGIPSGIESYFVVRDDLRKAALELKAAGKKLMIHNHKREFERFGTDNRTYLDQLMEDFTADELGITFDLYWAQAAGASPVAWLKKLSGRVPCVHFKDSEVHLDELRMAPVGFGNMDVEGCLRAAEEAGTEYFLVEQDKCNGIDPFLCLKHAYKCLSSYGYK